jgi:hypothetical protein
MLHPVSFDGGLFNPLLFMYSVFISVAFTGIYGAGTRHLVLPYFLDTGHDIKLCQTTSIGWYLRILVHWQVEQICPSSSRVRILYRAIRSFKLSAIEMNEG